MNKCRIILPNETKINQPNQLMEVSSPLQPGTSPKRDSASLSSTEAGLRQIPIFPVPVRSSGSFLIYALCLQAIETGMYADKPAMLPHLQSIKSVMEQEYLRFGIPMYEYRQFVIAKNQATNIEEVLARANITWEALLNLVNQRVESPLQTPLETWTVLDSESSTVKVSNGETWTVCNSESHTEKVCNGQTEFVEKRITGGEENAEMGTQKEER